MRRRGGLAVAGVLVVGACGGAPWNEGGDPQVEVVERVEGPAGSLVALGDVLVARTEQADEGVDGTTEALQRSSDQGRTWEPIGLPGAPERLTVTLGHLPGPDLAVVTGRDVVDSFDMRVPGGDAYLWTSADGRQWNGGVLAAGPPPFAGVTVKAAGDVLVAGVPVGGDLVNTPSRYVLHRSDDAGATWSPAVVQTDLTIAAGGRMELLEVWEADGRLVADLGLGRLAPGSATVRPGGAGSPPPTAVASGGTVSLPPPPPTEGVQAVLASDDGGATWWVAPCPAAAADTDSGTCARPEVYGDLRIRFDEVSVDGGRTWAVPAVAGGPPADGFAFRSVVELPSGGWLATTTEGEEEEIEGRLLRSGDGRTWDDLLPDIACAATTRQTGFTGPVPFGDGWLVTYRCSDFGDDPVSEAYTLDAGGTDPAPVPGTRRHAAYEDVTLAGETAVILAGGDGTTDLVLVTP
jgi:hypothetical protein